MAKKRVERAGGNPAQHELSKNQQNQTHMKITIKSIRYKALILLCFLFTSLLMPYLEPKTDKNPDITTA